MPIVNIMDCVPLVGPYTTYGESDNKIHMNKRNIMMIDDLHVGLPVIISTL